MKRFFAALLFILSVTSTALAVDTPHTATLGCLGCHIDNKDYLKGITGVNNLCLTCHNPGTMTKSFTTQDLANPFGSTDLGVYAAGQLQTSHNWAAPVNVPAAGAATPTNPAMQALKATVQGVISCSSCHSNHGNSTVSPELFRFANDSDQLCLDCHRVRNQRNHLSGTHPVNFDYTGATSKVKLKPTEYHPLPVNANPGNPTSAMRLVNGKVLCTTCHGVHFTDSNSATIDGPESSSFGLLSSSQGYLLRTDLKGGTANAINACTSCHAGKLAHNNKGQNIQCADCHGAHVDEADGTTPNVWLIRRYMNPENNSGKVLNQYTSSRSNWAGAFGVCVACHAIPAPGGSYPAEHASTDPDVCRSCHAHDSAQGSFSANCSGCHGFPPQQNVAGGPLGYAKGYAASPVFKDESLTPHFAHAGTGAYSYSCSECHAGNTHGNGNFQQVFIAKTGLGGPLATYNPAGAGSCLTTYCHSNGAPAGGTVVYKTPNWALAKNSIVGTPGECAACHDAAPGTNAHPGHLANNYACALCHAATVGSNSSIKDPAKHVNGVKDVLFSGQATLGGSATYNGGTLQCSNLYCHSNGKQGAFVYADPAAWNSGVNYGCNGCHGTANPIGAPEYANGGEGTSTANSHRAHTFGASDTRVCASCHYTTASATAAGTLTSGGKHLSGSADVVFDPALAGANASYDPATGNCSNIACHGGAPAIWGSTAGCLSCHSVAIRGRAAIAPQFGANSHHVQGTLTAAQCYQCHWEANSDGTINRTYHHSNIPGGPVELVIYGAGSRPTSYAVGTTATPYTANGTRTEMAKINSHCLGCHSDQNNATQPFGDGKTPSSYAWDSSSIATKYADTGITPWGKYSGGKTTPKSTVSKAFSAHGNASANKGGWNTSETWPDTRGTVTVLCFDCHNSHGSTVAGTTTSYKSATANGGILKDTTAGIGGYAQSYKPAAGGSAATRNLYNPGAGLCFDCHLNANPGTTPWGYSGTFGSSQQIMGYMDSAYFGSTAAGSGLRYPYKAALGNMGGHFGTSSSLDLPPDAAHQIGGLCTPCHDPHGVSPTLGANKMYAVPMLKGTWLTSPYKEDVAPADNVAYKYMNASAGGDEAPQPAAGTANAYLAAKDSYKIDQNTFASGSITETDQQFAGLCLNCHAKQTLTDGVTHTWKDKNRIHESVKGWKTANGTIKHSYSCSKCHAPHNASLPRLMVSNCLDAPHRGQMPNNTGAITSGSGSGSKGDGSGRMPGFWAGGRVGDRGGYSTSSSDAPAVKPSPSVGSCHEGNDTTQKWNVKTPWVKAGTAPTAPTVPVITTVTPSVCSSSCTVPMSWSASAGSSSSVQYLVQVSTSSSFATINYNSGWISATSWSRALSTNTTYYWRVQARDSVTTTLVSAWSQTGTFRLSSTTTATAPTTPALNTVTPITCASSCSVPMTWSASAGANSIQYQVQVSTSSSFSSITASSGWISATSWSRSLSTNTTYYWRVQARNAVTTTLVSAWSQAGTFRLSSTTTATAPTTPALNTVTPGSCASSCPVPMTWSASTGASSIQYQAQVSTSSSFSSIAASSGWISGTSWSSTSLATNTTYYWRVQARNGTTTTLISAWSQTGSFSLASTTGGGTATAPTTPTLTTVTPSRCSSSCPVPIRWNASVGSSVQYLVQVSTSSSFSSTSASSGWISGTSWTSPSLRTGTTYYWRVQARNGTTTSLASAWSTVGTFRLSSR